MTNTELYYTLFIDSLLSHLLFFLDSEYVIWVVNLFESDSKVFLLLFSVLGFVLASIINYVIGLLIYKISSRFFSNVHDARYKNIKIVLDKYYFIVLLTLLLPGIQRFTFILFGFYQIKPNKILIFGTCIKLIYYMYYIV